MEALTAVVLRAKHGSFIAAAADILVPFGWTAIVSVMMSKLGKLPVRALAGLTITAVEIDHDGLLFVDFEITASMMPSGSVAEIESIMQDAKNHAAWSCVRDGKAAWIVAPPTGMPRPLCPECQASVGIETRAAHV